VLRCEELGIPQARHRVIIVGVRRDLLHEGFAIGALGRRPSVKIEDVISDLPRIRSGISPRDSVDAWTNAVQEGQEIIASENGELSDPRSVCDVLVGRLLAARHDAMGRSHRPPQRQGERA
jgi:DNA (cytosine-5)-methyltransferase 1